MIAHAEREAPIEACGYLGGSDGRIYRHYPLVNADAREDHFSFDPEEQFAVIKAMRREGLFPLAIYHSHPATPARPSVEDIRLSYDSTILYVIVSLMDNTRIVKGFHIMQGRVEEQGLTIEENQS